MNSESGEICVLCCRKIDIYAYGNCCHAVCHECCTRIRVLCEKHECPICRQDLTQVYYSTDFRPFETIDFRGRKQNFDYKIVFDSSYCETAFYKLLSHTCKLCPHGKSFPNFMQLKDHMKKMHELLYCNLCVENTKLFSFERQCYTKLDLNRHRQFGDPNNKSLRAHPLCKFCNERYMDDDELYRHLRKDHYFCHFCDADGSHLFYRDYPGLKEHFREAHFLCEEGDCLTEQFTSVFRTDIDLRAHKASAHSRNLSKAKAKQARTLDVNFLLKPRPKQHHFANTDENGPIDKSLPFFRKRKDGAEKVVDNASKEDLSDAEERSPPTAFYATDFPTLDNKSESNGRVDAVFRAPVWQGGKRQSAVKDPVDFPSLSSSTSSFPSNNWVIGNAKATTGESNSVKKKIPINSLSLQSFDDFPVLKSKTKKTINNGVEEKSSQGKENDITWVPVKNKPLPKKNEEINKIKELKIEENDEITISEKESTKKKTKAPNIQLESFDDFPVLEKKSKKSTSVMIPSQETTKSKSKSNANKIKKVVNANEYSTLVKIIPPPNVAETRTTPPIESDWNPLQEIEKTVSFGTEDFPELQTPTAIKYVTVEKAKPKVKAPREKTKKINSTSKVTLKDDSFSLQGLADSLKLTNPGKKKIKNEIANGIKKNNHAHDNVKTDKAASSKLCDNLNLDNGFVKQAQDYQPPDNFQQRNVDLIKKIQTMFNNSDTSFGDFKSISGQFRQSEISAKNYYEKCSGLLGNNGMTQAFPELLVLLPDIKKQQELLSVYKCEQKKSKSGANLDKTVNVCSVCQQVLSKQDFAVHKLRHS